VSALISYLVAQMWKGNTYILSEQHDTGVRRLQSGGYIILPFWQIDDM
jgi:hypothetical protein